MVNII